MRGQLIIWGAGGHGKVVLDAARAAGWARVVLLDTDPAKSGSFFCGCLVAGGAEQLPRLAGSAFVIAVGDNRARARCFLQACELGLEPAVLIHPAGVVSPSARLGSGCVIMAGSVISAAAAIGENCIVNHAAVVEHDCVVGAHVHISPRAVLGGAAAVGTLAHIGLGAIVHQNSRRLL